MYYHIRIKKKDNREEFKVDISEQELTDRYVQPYLNGESFVMNGTMIDFTEVARIKIAGSDESIAKEASQISIADSFDKSEFKFLNPSAEYRAIDKLPDVTDNFINRVPKAKKKNEARMDHYINAGRIGELKSVNGNNGFDLWKLIRLCEEINSNWQLENFFSVITLTRTILHHVPPVFSCKNFEEVANNYSGGSSFKKSMQHLLHFSKNIADTHLHSQVQQTVVLPNAQQVDCRNGIDLLLAEAINILKVVPGSA